VTPAAVVPIDFEPNRTKLIGVLEGLAPADLTRVITLVDGAAQRDLPYLTVGERVASLIRYVESSVGPKLKPVAAVVVHLFPNTVDKLRPFNSRSPGKRQW